MMDKGSECSANIEKYVSREEYEKVVSENDRLKKIIAEFINNISID